MTGNLGGMTSTLETEAITAVCIVGTALKKYFETSPLFPKVGNAENAAD